MCHEGQTRMSPVAWSPQDGEHLAHAPNLNFLSVRWRAVPGPGWAGRHHGLCFLAATATVAVAGWESAMLDAQDGETLYGPLCLARNNSYF